MGLVYLVEVIAIELAFLTMSFVLINHKTGWLVSFHLNSVQEHHKLGRWSQGEGGRPKHLLSGRDTHTHSSEKSQCISAFKMVILSFIHERDIPPPN